MHGSNTKTTKAGEGFGLYSKPQEVRTQTISEVRLPGLTCFTRFGSYEAHARQVDQTSGDVPSPLLKVCYQCKDSYVHHWIACINGEDCKIGQDAYETFLVASQDSLEISDASGHTDPLESEDDTTWGMVVRPSKCATRRTSPPQGTRKTDIYRRLNAGWGAHSGQNSTGGLWSLSEKHLHINLLEMKAVLLVLQFFKTDCRNNQVLIPSDNTSAVVYINKQGDTKSAELCALMWRILTWCHLNKVTLRARHVPGSLRVIADGLSRRNQIQSTEWSLSPQIFKQISKLWESPQVDLFATSLNEKLPPDSGSSGIGSRCPQHSMGKHGCLHVPSHCPAAQGCTKTSITNMQDNSDSPRLADKTMVLGPGGDVSGHSKTTTTHTHSAKTTTEQPLPCQPSIPEPPHLVSRSSALQEHGFTAEVAERIAAPQRLSTRSIYTSKWTVFQRWCTEKQVVFRSPSIGDICNFFWYLFNDLNRCPSTIEGYRTTIADTLGNTKQNISTNPEIASFHRDKPKSSRSIPKWNLSLVLQRLTQPPFEPQEEAALKFLTWKTVFLLALVSGKRRSEIHAWTLDGLLCLGEWDQIQLSPSPSFIAKNQLAKEGPQSLSPVVIPALKCSQDSPDTDVLLCPVRALQCYLDRTKDSRGGRQLLFISYKLGHSKDI